ncbi:MAG: hypothetical protein M5U07_07945 [Xanthobacteraceae bacterium]|nr:hypothetical protein [Xanthobacteraceae bacterium]
MSISAPLMNPASSGAQERDQGRDLFGLAEPARRSRGNTRSPNHLRHRPHLLGGDQARQHGVAGDAEACELECHVACQAEKAGLAGGVAGLQGQSAARGRRRYVDDAPPALFRHTRRDQADQVEGAAEVYANLSHPGVGGHLRNRSDVVHYAGAIDENADIPERRSDRHNRRFHRGGIGHVHGPGARRSAGGDDLRGDLRDVRVPVEQREHSLLAREAEGGDPADAARRPGDQHNTPLVPHLPPPGRARRRACNLSNV